MNLLYRIRQESAKRTIRGLNEEGEVDIVCFEGSKSLNESVEDAIIRRAQLSDCEIKSAWIQNSILDDFVLIRGKIEGMSFMGCQGVLPFEDYAKFKTVTFSFTDIGDLSFINCEDMLIDLKHSKSVKKLKIMGCRNIMICMDDLLDVKSIEIVGNNVISLEIKNSSITGMVTENIQNTTLLEIRKCRIGGWMGAFGKRIDAVHITNSKIYNSEVIMTYNRGGVVNNVFEQCFVRGELNNDLAMAMKASGANTYILNGTEVFNEQIPF